MKLPHCSIWILAILAWEGSSTKVQYNGDQVLKLIPETLQHAGHIREICTELQLDLWMPHMVEGIYPGTEVHVRVPVTHLPRMKENLHQHAINYEILINDVQELIDIQPVHENIRRRRSLDQFDYTKYHPMEEIYAWMDQIKVKYSDLVTQHYLGSTYESRHIYYFKIGWPSDKTKKIIWIDCGIHAREWISVAYCQWFIKELLENSESNPLLKEVLRNIDFYIVPVLNIDGYIYSWTTDRLWRKNRSPYNKGTCYGVDLNRNFNARWCSIGASQDCQSLTFCGSGPESEPETKAVAQLVGAHKSDFLIYMTIHSYSQLILLPYGYMQDPSSNHAEMLTVAQKAADKLKEKHGTQYRVGSASHILYYNSGSSRDWATDLGIQFSYTFELRDNGTFGFVLPEDQIKPTCEETMAGMMTIIEYLNDKHFNGATSIFSGGIWINLCLSFIIGTYYSIC
ncbi:carboxypeptidase O-like [Discoglossus pictus]